jgi:hypothetical protein
VLSSTHWPASSYPSAGTPVTASVRRYGETPDARPAAQGNDRKMTHANSGECPGSLTAPPINDPESTQAPCPVCGAQLLLGYAGRLPTHDDAARGEKSPFRVS